MSGRQKTAETGRASMNYSILTADRNTHLKIITLALIAALTVAVIGLNARVEESGNLVANAKTNGPVVKANNKAIQITTRDGSEVR
jgi:hypothetical protein